MDNDDEPRPAVEAPQPRAHSARRIALTLLAFALALGVVGGAVYLYLDRAPARAAHTPAGPDPVHTTPTPSGPRPSGPTPSEPTPSTPVSEEPTRAPEPPAAQLTAAQRAAVRYPGAPPVTPQTIYNLHPKHKYIALTLDDGYNLQMGMLELLEQEHVPVTTFLIGSVVADNHDVVQRMADDGFEIANHTWNHKILSKASTQTIESQLTRCQDTISAITGNQAPYLRPPGGGTNKRVERTAAGLGYRVVLWNRSFGDTGGGATPDKVYANVMKTGGGVHAGDIILGHWGSPSTYQALKRIIPELRAQGFEFVTVSQLIEDSEEPASAEKL
ncbi:MAG: polysaccharide deacetylase family protein [Coriobacteriia bacterium]